MKSLAILFLGLAASNSMASCPDFSGVYEMRPVETFRQEGCDKITIITEGYETITAKLDGTPQLKGYGEYYSWTWLGDAALLISPVSVDGRPLKGASWIYELTDSNDLRGTVFFQGKSSSTTFRRIAN